jgi:hypothetical protein
MFHLRTLIVAALLLLGGFSIGSCYSAGSHPVTQDRTAPTLQQIQMLAQLTTLRLDVADVQVTHLEGKLGGMSVALVLRAQIDIATDLTAARLENVDPVNRTATLILPMPTAMPPRIDHERSQLFAFDTRGLWQINPQNTTYARLVNQCYRAAEQAIANMAASDPITGNAKQQAEAVIRAFCNTLGWEVVIQWHTGPA